MTRRISSEKARANWREILDAVAGGETIVVERYGQPVATLAPYIADAVTASGRVREATPVYDTVALAQFKAEIVAEVLAEIEAQVLEPLAWQEGVTLLQQQIAESGGLGFGDDPEAIVAQVRRTRREIWDEEYAHLYR